MSDENSESSESENNNSTNSYSICDFCNSDQSIIQINQNNYTLIMENENSTNLNTINENSTNLNTINENSTNLHTNNENQSLNQIVSSSYYTSHISDFIGNTSLQIVNSSANNFINSESSYEEEQTTDYNNEETANNFIQYNEEQLNLQIDSNPNLFQWSNQYSMLYNDDIDNPFFKCNVKNLDYETDEDEKLLTYRIIYFWNYEFNYDYFSLNDVFIFNTKTETFKSKLNELKNLRNKISNNTTGNIIKIESKKKLLKLVNLYLIAYYDNAKSNIEFYGAFNQEIDENKLIENIKRESIYGNKGIVSSSSITNLGENDFIILHRKVNII